MKRSYRDVTRAREKCLWNELRSHHRHWLAIRDGTSDAFDETLQWRRRADRVLGRVEAVFFVMRPNVLQEDLLAAYRYKKENVLPELNILMLYQTKAENVTLFQERTMSVRSLLTWISRTCRTGRSQMTFISGENLFFQTKSLIPEACFITVLTLWETLFYCVEILNKV